MPGAPANVVLGYLRQLTAGADTGPLPDEELLGRFVARRDEESFAALVRRHGPMVWRLCRRALHSEHDAEDVFQATFLVLHRKAAALAGCDSLAGWLYGVASRLAMKARTASARRRARESRAAAPSPPDPLAEISVREAQDILDQELLRMPEKLRAPLVLCCLEGLTRDEAAQRLGWSVSLVKSRLEQARELLSKRLPRRGLAPSVAFLTLLVGGQTVRAAVPRALLSTTVQAAAGHAAGASPGALALAKGMVPGIVAARLRCVTAVLLLVGTLGVGAAGLVGAAGSSSVSPRVSQLKPDVTGVQAQAVAPTAAAARGEAESDTESGEALPPPQADPDGAAPARMERMADGGQSVRRNETATRSGRPARSDKAGGRSRPDDDWRERARAAAGRDRSDDDEWERGRDSTAPRARARPGREDRPHR
jgi:RNA polymerase sigma factor (sigma-70 family)